MIVLTSISCSTSKVNPEKWTDEEVNSWFNQKEWLSDWDILPDASINKRNFAIYYHKNPRHWEQAFTFLKTADLKNLPLGKQELEGEHLFVSVAEYMGKEKEEVLFESHKKYIDIQNVIKRKEIMGITTLDKVEVAEPYNEEKDITFYTYNGGNYLKATPENFFIFLPEDVHRPSIKTNANVPIRKIVVKIYID